MRAVRCDLSPIAAIDIANWNEVFNKHSIQFKTRRGR